MRIGILSDIHGNLEALNAAIDSLEKARVDQIVCLGDVVGYGPDPEDCLRRISSIANEIVAGNHDFAAAGKQEMARFNPLARQTIENCQGEMSQEALELLGQLPLTRELESANGFSGSLLVHSRPDHPDAWLYVITPDDAAHAFAAFEGVVCFTGHSHVPGVFFKNPDGSISRNQPHELLLRETHQYIINVGSVGQPRDGDPRACCGLLDTNSHHFQWIRSTYPIRTVQEKMEAAQFPSPLIGRLERGQ